VWRALPVEHQSVNDNGVGYGKSEGKSGGGPPGEAGMIPEANVGETRPGVEVEAAYARALRAELERRLTEIARYDDGVFGRTGLVDAIVTIGLCVLLPIAAVLAAWSWR